MSIEAIRAALEDYMATTSPTAELEAETRLAKLARPLTVAILLDRLDAAEKAVQWQPIETAPRTGRDLILLLTPSGFPQVAYSNTWWTAGFSVECEPTHWMPLPAAPAAMEGE